MRINYQSPESLTARLGDLGVGAVFRFPDSKGTPYMRLDMDGAELLHMLKFRSDKRAFVDYIVCKDENYYLWGEGESKFDMQEYFNDEAECEELLVYLDLATGYIWCSHCNEQVVILNAELTVTDERSA